MPGSARIIPIRREGFALNGVFGTALFVFVEVMLFAGFISAFVIVKNGVTPGMWPPPNQPRLSFERTTINTAALLASGVTLFLANRAHRRRVPAERGLLTATLLLGIGFVLFQGLEWAALLHQGLTITSSLLGSFFYVIIGAHAVHAVAALAVLAICWWQQRRGRLKDSVFGGAQVFWYFVVLMWPVIWTLVYRS